MINNKLKSFCCFLFFLIYVSFSPNLEAQAGKGQANSNLIKDYLSSMSEFLQVEPTLLDPSDAETLNRISQDLRNNLVTNPSNGYSRIKVQEKDDQGRRKMNLLNIAYSDLSTIKEIEEAHKDIKNHLKEHGDGSDKINEGNVLERSVKVLNHFESILAKVKKTGFHSILGNEQNFKALKNLSGRMKYNLGVIEEGKSYLESKSLTIPIWNVQAMREHLNHIDTFLEKNWNKVKRRSNLNLQNRELKNDRDKAYRVLAPWSKVLSDATTKQMDTPGIKSVLARPRKLNFFQEEPKMSKTKKYSKVLLNTSKENKLRYLQEVQKRIKNIAKEEGEKSSKLKAVSMTAKKVTEDGKKILTSFCFGTEEMNQQRDANNKFKSKFKNAYKVKSSSIVISAYDVVDKLPLPSAITGVMSRLGELKLENK